MIDRFGNQVYPSRHRFGYTRPSPIDTRRFGMPKDPGDPVTLRYLRMLMPGPPITYPPEKDKAITVFNRRISNLEDPLNDSDAVTKVFAERMSLQTAGNLLRGTLETLQKELETKTLEQAITSVLSQFNKQ